MAMNRGGLGKLFIKIEMAGMPPCASDMFVTQKSGRVQIVVYIPTLKKWTGYRPVFHILLWLRHQAEYI